MRECRFIRFHNGGMDTLSQLRAGKLTGVKRLTLSCGLTEFPPEIFDLADSLEILDLSGNALQSLPNDLNRLHNLTVLFCSDNAFTVLPEVLGECTQLRMVGFKANRIRTIPDMSLSHALRWLILTQNRIEALPATLGRCTGMQKLMLAGNRLQKLPDTMADCRQLELLRIASNRFSALPDWLLALPRLSWLAYADNPLCDMPAAARIAPGPSISSIQWQALTLGPRLGEGASGIIHQADWQRETGTSHPMAVKLFKGSMTSDGTPQSEMAASIAAGPHPNLIDIAGQIAAHPEDASGLVMQLIDPAFKNLAGPPSLASCTRDIYPEQTRFSPAVAIKMAIGIADATRHLHACGILHGDLYAHNILWNGQGDCLLGDFGAASLFQPQEIEQAQALQRIEARAFGCLLEELLDRCNGWEEHVLIQQELRQLQARCMQAEVNARPLLDEIHGELTGLFHRLG